MVQILRERLSLHRTADLYALSASPNRGGRETRTRCPRARGPTTAPDRPLPSDQGASPRVRRGGRPESFGGDGERSPPGPATSGAVPASATAEAAQRPPAASAQHTPPLPRSYPRRLPGPRPPGGLSEGRGRSVPPAATRLRLPRGGAHAASCGGGSARLRPPPGGPRGRPACPPPPGRARGSAGWRRGGGGAPNGTRRSQTNLLPSPSPPAPDWRQQKPMRGRCCAAPRVAGQSRAAGGGPRHPSMVSCARATPRAQRPSPARRGAVAGSGPCGAAGLRDRPAASIAGRRGLASPGESPRRRRRLRELRLRFTFKPR